MIRINGDGRGGDGRSRPVRRWSRAGRHPVVDQPEQLDHEDQRAEQRQRRQLDRSDQNGAQCLWITAKRLRRQRKHPKVEDGEVFVIRGQEPALPEFSEDGRPLPTEDVGLFARLTSPLTSTRALTWCSGIFAGGVLAAVRLLTDAGPRGKNAAYLTQRFADATQFAILARVSVLLGETITPDLLNEDARLYEWSDAEPRQPGEARPDGDASKATSR